MEKRVAQRVRSVWIQVALSVEEFGEWEGVGRWWKYGEEGMRGGVEGSVYGGGSIG